jgi:hypothetical protein
MGVIGVKDEAELHMLANIYVVDRWRPSRIFLYSSMGLSLSIYRASREATRSCRVFKRIETLYLHSSRTITAARSRRAFTCMHVASRIAGSPNPVS